ncbi:[FeFe] hydrogenase H-cluster radical SAM maturase HydE [Proteinivorax hydrogeniformans]|uniref:[FeFe] hydrogenase H-cluster radical SAM maturase HydE n=1 Tax=Proteinivorax hydrogeniformans TaxID=1826727 RepID=A0AAU8HT77_9FIRM
MKTVIDKLCDNQSLNREEFEYLLDNIDDKSLEYLREKADEVRIREYGRSVYTRGIIEFTNYCKQNCVYCGIRHDNKKADRYRLSAEEILDCCDAGYKLGYRTFVLQGGEDPYYTDEKIIEVIRAIKKALPDCALTLSLGEKSFNSLKQYYEAGADRYLLRHETAALVLYKKYHPNMSLESRKQCLWNLKKIGYQVGAGFLVGLPKQTTKDYVEDLMFLKKLQPEMIGIGPFIAHDNTPLEGEVNGSVRQVVTLLAIVRLMLPKVLLPATTALGSVDPIGREQGIRFGANVVMPNLSPTNVRAKYALYNGKICVSDEAAQCRKHIEGKVSDIGYSLDMSRGDHKNWRRL